MRITQGCFSFLPDLSKEQIRNQIKYALSKGYAISLEYTKKPHPRNCYWEMWGLPLFDLNDPDAIMWEIDQLAKSKPASKGYYLKLLAFDNTRGIESCVMSFILQRPIKEAAYEVSRHHLGAQKLRYTIFGPIRAQ